MNKQSTSQNSLIIKQIPVIMIITIKVQYRAENSEEKIYADLKINGGLGYAMLFCVMLQILYCCVENYIDD